MSTVVALFVVIVAVIAQAAVMPMFSIFGAQPNLPLVLLIAWMTVRRRREALLLIPAAGFSQGLLDSQSVGVAMLAMAPLILMTEVRGLRLVDSDLLPAVGLVMLGTLTYETITLITLTITGERLDFPAILQHVVAPSMIANVLLLLPVYGLIQLASVDLRPREAI